YFNPESLVVASGALVEPSVAGDPPGSRYQFERVGYFCSDVVDSKPAALVFNRTVTLRDTWAKASQAPAAEPERAKRAKKAERAEPADGSAKPKPRAAPAGPRDPAMDAESARLRSAFGLGADEA